MDARVLPRGWKDVFRQLLLFVGAYLICELVSELLSNGDSYKRVGDATRLIDIERWLHMFAEPSVQIWAQNKHWLMDVADWTYLNAHYFVTVSALIFIYLRRNDSFYFVRNMFMTAMAVGLVGYWLYPTAPPRLLPEWGFTDSISQFLGGSGSGSPQKALLGFYATVPSMHVCFALMISWPMVRFVKHWWARIAWGLYPLWITFVVVATGNHYFIDVFLGCLTAAIAALLAHHLISQPRPPAQPPPAAPATVKTHPSRTRRRRARVMRKASPRPEFVSTIADRAMSRLSV